MPIGFKAQRLPDPSEDTEVQQKLSESPDDTTTAYGVCKQFEDHCLNSSGNPTDIAAAIASARVLGYLLIYLPPAAVAEVTRSIQSCNEDYGKLRELGDAFVNWFIRAFRKNKGRTPLPSSHPSRPSFDADRRLLKVSIKEAPKDHSTAKALALERDGYRCQVSGIYDKLVKTKLGPPKDQLTGYGYLVRTECAHIIPESTYFGVGKTNEGNNKRDYAASVLAVLQRFGCDVESLNGANVHSLINVITLQKDVHHDFDTLQLWLDATDTPNQYCIGAVSSEDIPPGRSLVTFTTEEDLPLPSAELLALHAACAKVANLSGAAEYLDDLERRSRELEVLASDGGSAAVLEYAIAGLVGGEIQVGASTPSTTEY